MGTASVESRSNPASAFGMSTACSRDSATNCQPSGDSSFRTSPDGVTQLVVVMPLGVSVPQGIAIQVGKTKRNVAFTQCLPGGCVAPLPVDDAFLSVLKAGKEGRVGVVDRRGQTVAVPFSLKGFVGAFDKMEEHGGIGSNGATWWSGFANPSETK